MNCGLVPRLGVISFFCIKSDEYREWVLNGLRIIFVITLVIISAGWFEGAYGTDISTNTAVLGWLDKVTARVNTLRVSVDERVRFGTLEIAVRSCFARPPEEPPENVAYIEVWQLKSGQELPDTVFQGWMFSSSPALSAMEHPVYDIWVLECIDSSRATSK